MQQLASQFHRVLAWDAHAQEQRQQFRIRERAHFGAVAEAVMQRQLYTAKRY
jgi:hypothetical protein